MEDLKETYSSGGKWSWIVMVKEHPNQFSGECPTTGEARRTTLNGFPIKQDQEVEWIRKNAPKLLKRHGKSILGLFPEDL